MSFIQPFTGAFIIISGSGQDWKCPCRWSQITLWMAANVQQLFGNHEVRCGISTEATSIWSQAFKSMTPFFLFVVSAQGRSCSLSTTTRRSERAKWSTTLSRCHFGSKTVTRGSKVWRPTGWITWLSTSTMEPHLLMDTSTWAMWTVSQHESG